METDKVVVEQIDRDAYADEVERLGDKEYADRIRAGQRDTLSMLTMLARHRLSAEARSAGPADVVERVARALCAVAVANARAKFGNDTVASTYGWEDWIPDARAAIAATNRSDWFAGDVDCDGNELATVRADALKALYERACEVVHHEPDCEHGGRGDKYCTCDAVPFLRDFNAIAAIGSSGRGGVEAVVDSGLSPSNLDHAETVWSNLPTGRKWASLATHEKALVVHVLARRVAASDEGVARALWIHDGNDPDLWDAVCRGADRAWIAYMVEEKKSYRDRAKAALAALSPQPTATEETAP